MQVDVKVKINITEYDVLLKKYSSNPEIIRLLDLAVLEEERRREQIYISCSRYPERRDILSRLRQDLISSLDERLDINSKI